jgi:hypothetical protein
MYYAIVATLMFAFPLISIGVEASLRGEPVAAVLIGKWFVFWAVGWRLLLAGIRQIIQPGYTARVILGFKSDESLLLVRELGFANAALGLVGIVSLFVPSWQLAAALAGGVFYGLAGINHARQPHRNRMANVAMTSDLFISMVLLWVCVTAALVA